MRQHSTEAVVYTPPEAVIEPAFADNNIPVFFGCDNKFLPHSLAVIASFMAHADPENNYDIFILQGGVPKERMDAAAEWIKRYDNARLRFVNIDPVVDMVGRKYFSTTREYSVAVFFRIFAPGIFTRYDKMAYLDSDIVFFDDVAGFYNQDLEGNQIGACHDYVSEHQSLVNPEVGDFWRRELNLEPGQDFFFSGGLVMDLAQMREKNSFDIMLKKARDIVGSKLPDQDVMNSILQGQVKYIGSEWNYLDWMYDPEEESRNFGLLAPDKIGVLRRARGEVKVLHYAEKKPWTMEYAGKNGAHYWKYASETPFYEDIIGSLVNACHPLKMATRELGITGQEWNFRLRSLFCPDTKKGKYESRLHNLRMRRFGLAQQAKMAQYLAAGRKA